MRRDKGRVGAVNDKTQGVTIDTRFIAVPENKAWLDAEAEKMKGGTANGSS